MDVESGHVATDFADLSIKFTQSHRSLSQNLIISNSQRATSTRIPRIEEMYIASNSTN